MIILIIYIFILIQIMTFPQSSSNYFYALNSINGDSIKKHLFYLASDELQGRGLGSIGSELASNYISNYFSQLRLKKIPNKNSYFQEIPMHGSKPLVSSELIVVVDSSEKRLDYGLDYFLFKSGQQTFIPQPLEIIFVGYGIVAPEFDYNDYQSVDVEGKVVIYLDGEPYSEDPEFFNGKKYTRYSSVELKRRTAISRGAAGTILIPMENYTNWADVKRDFDIEDVNLAYDLSSNLSLIINPKSLEIFFEGSDYSYDDLIKMHLKNRIHSFKLKSKLKFKGAFKERSFIERNVIGILSGTDKKLKDSYLIVSAHYDHLGIGKSIDGDSIYNGALDNAIGVAVMLELARVLSQLELKRTIIFIATTGEERGLLGAKYYTENPLFPLYKTVANLNIDGIALFRDFNSLIVLGKEFSNLGLFAEQTAKRFGLKIEDIQDEIMNFGVFSNSDHFAFAQAGIPSVIIIEGFENKSLTRDEVKQEFMNYYENYYHTPKDDLKQNIDLIAAERHAKILFDFIYNLASSIEAPEWFSDSPFLQNYLRNLAEKK
ncbi:MAG: M28 family peptidase [Ignavibacterium sp.]|nr:M28 family peptidase [Ignavibacterium sp.]MDW8376177.1 M28 family peptidase [Ignavibacteriales bacterium]